MSRFSRNARLAFGLLPLVVVGCSETPTILGDERGSITMRYDQGSTDKAAVDKLAQRQCDSWNKTAQIADTRQSGSNTDARYTCR